MEPGVQEARPDANADTIRSVIISSDEYQRTPVKQWPMAERKAVKHPRHQETAAVTLNTVTTLTLKLVT